MSKRRILTNAIPFRFDVSADYEHGARQQLAVDEEEAQALAFGAIRRAAAVARECEAKGWEQTTISLQWAWWNKAHEIRRAIRAAIGEMREITEIPEIPETQNRTKNGTEMTRSERKA